MAMSSSDDLGSGSEPASDSQLCFLPVAEVVKRFADAEDELTPSAMLEACIARIEATEDKLNAFVLTTFDHARKQAAAATRRWAVGTPLSAIDGVPLGLKDLFDTARVTTAGGCHGLRDRVPEDDADVVESLKAAGTVIVGKLSCTELASGGILNPHYREEVTRNPYDLRKTPGTSSSGTASAVAACQVLVGMGTDTGGSIRGPAAFCGLTGMKPTFGLVSGRGVLPLSRSLDTPGPMCRSAYDCALLLSVLCGADDGDPDPRAAIPSEAPRGREFIAPLAVKPVGWKLATVPSLMADLSADVKSQFDKALAVFRQLGCEILEIEPLAGTRDEDLDCWELLSAIILPEKAAYYSEILLETPDQVSSICRDTTLPYVNANLTNYVQALAKRERVEAAFERALESRGIAAYVVPTTKVTAPMLPTSLAELQAQRMKFSKTSHPDEKAGKGMPILQNNAYNTMIFNITRQPSIAFPMGSDLDGMPTSCMLSGRKWHDADVLQLAHAFQSATTHHLALPGV